MAKIGSDSNMRDTFIEAAARAFFVCAYADWVEEEEREDDGFDYAQPGAGEDWMDFAPPTPPAAYALAGELWARLEAANPNVPAGMYGIVELADKADRLPEGALGAAYDPDFGHYMAMEAMGHGVAWWDDHEKFPLEVPYMEVSQFSFDTAAYQGKCYE